jgi:hypothetical protein
LDGDLTLVKELLRYQHLSRTTQVYSGVGADIAMEINTSTTSIVAHPNFVYFPARYCSSLTCSIRSTTVLLFLNGDARHSRGWHGTVPALFPETMTPQNAIMSAAAKPLPDTSPMTNARRSSGRQMKSGQSPPNPAQGST